MTDSNEKPSFLARFSILATIVTIIFQSLTSFTIGSDAAVLVTLIYPAFSYMVIAGIYYLFKGKPTEADTVIAGGLYQVWFFSLVIGAVVFFLQKNASGS
jgi:hypothetical protein